MTRDSLPRSQRSAPHRTAPRPHGDDRRDDRRRLQRAPTDRRDGVPPKEAQPLPGPAQRERQTAPLHREDALFYAPPYASQQAPNVLADRLAQQLVRHLQPACGLHNERIALTPRDCFRLDFLIEANPADAGVERAGILLGEREEAKSAPALYDALIVGSRAVDVLYRFDPAGLDAHLGDALFLMSRHDPVLFARRERLQTRASKGVCSGRMRGPQLRLSYPAPPVEGCPGKIPQRPAETPDLVMRRLHRDEPEAWIDDYRRALDYFGVEDRRPQTEDRSIDDG